MPIPLLAPLAGLASSGYAAAAPWLASGASAAGTALANPAVQSGLAGLATQAAPSAFNWLGQQTGLWGGQQQDEIGDYLRQQYRQQPQNNFDQIRQEEMRRFQQDIIPQLQQQIASGGMGGQHSGAYFQQPQRATQDLSTRLGALQAQFQQQEESNRMSRLGGLRALRGGDQTYGLQRARQRQIGAQSRAGLTQGILQGLEGLRGQEMGQRENQFQNLYRLIQPNIGQMVREGNRGINVGDLTPLQRASMKQFGMQQGIQAPTS